MRRNKKWNMLTAALACIAFMGGCQDAKDIHEKLFTTTICCDYRDGEVWLYGEIANIEQSQSNGSDSGSTGNKYYIIEAHGKTFAQARLDMDFQMHQPLYLSGVRTLLLTERFAEKYLLAYLFRLRADETYRKKVITITTQDDPDEIFQTLNERGLSVGFCIEHLIQTLDESGESFTRSTSRILENLSSKYCGILIPCVELSNKEIVLAGYSVVNGPVVVDFIPVDESIGLNLLKADEPETHYTISYKGVQYTIRTSMTKRKTEALYEQGAVQFVITLSFEAFIEYGDTKTPYNIDDTQIQQIQQLLTGTIERDIKFAVEQAQRIYQTDYLQLDDAFRIRYPVAYEAMNWQEEFLKANISIDVQVDLSEDPMMDYGSNESK